jgi:hypothetical protein
MDYTGKKALDSGLFLWYRQYYSNPGKAGQ